MASALAWSADPNGGFRGHSGPGKMSMMRNLVLTGLVGVLVVGAARAERSGPMRMRLVKEMKKPGR